MKTKLFYVTSLVLILVIFKLALFGGRNNNLNEYKETRPLYGADLNITCLYPDKTDIYAVIEQCWKRADEIQVEMNAMSKIGYVARLNESGISGVKVSPSVYDVIKRSVGYSVITGGTFDITVLPLVELWRKAQEIQEIPGLKEIELTREKVGYQHIAMADDLTIYLRKKGMKIDLGAVAKGYAVDEIAKILLSNKIKNFILDAGGDILVGGVDSNGKKWKIGVQDPEKSDNMLVKLKVTNKGVTTSGNYSRSYTIQDKEFSHIMNPLTGMPQKEVISATVIADSSFSADAYSTALAVMGGAKGIKLINSTKNVEAMVIEKKGWRTVTYRSKGWGKYI